MNATGVSKSDFQELNSNTLIGIGVTLLVGGIWLHELRNFRGKRIKKKPYNVKDEERFNYFLLNFLVHLLNSGDSSKTQEFKFLEENFLKYFSQKKASQLMELLIADFMVNPASLDDLFAQASEDLSSSERSHLLYLLVATATVDRFLSNAEQAVLLKVADGIGISKNELESNLKLFRFETELQKQQREKDQEWSKMNKEERGSFHQQQEKERLRNKKPIYSLDSAYLILGILTSATNRDVKKAFRKLAFKFHPDKLGNLGEEHIKIAEEKFRQILDAYETIKKSRGMK